ncbi:hypothetical protein PUN28_007620 [Cardiocondyla obscurior]|uniref:Uncharacterized protein n=1 Tax=Cardiocondyla obscurior TaxID=286306 RepID=A0AAW2G9B5_9HYME
MKKKGLMLFLLLARGKVGERKRKRKKKLRKREKKAEVHRGQEGPLGFTGAGTSADYLVGVRIPENTWPVQSKKETQSDLHAGIFSICIAVLSLFIFFFFKFVIN